jgi:hypothetical protein
LTELPVPPSQRGKQPVSAEIEETLLACLRKDLEQRPQSVAELRTRLVANPRLADWRPEARAGWWSTHRSRVAAKPAAAPGAPPDALAPTVKVDLAERLA